jgi:hypothetical protein
MASATSNAIAEISFPDFIDTSPFHFCGSVGSALWPGWEVAGCDFADATLHRLASAVNGAHVTSHDIFLTWRKRPVLNGMETANFVARDSQSGVRLSRID